MMDGLQRCMEWMMALGWVGMVLGVLFLAAWAVLIVALVRRLWNSPRR